jgi:hypothetical protein
MDLYYGSATIVDLQCPLQESLYLSRNLNTIIIWPKHNRVIPSLTAYISFMPISSHVSAEQLYEHNKNSPEINH